MLYRMIEDPQEGDTVQFLGVYALRWPRGCGVEPTVAFIEVEPESEPLCAILAAALEILIEQDIRQDEVEEAGRQGSCPQCHLPEWPEAWGKAHDAIERFWKEYPDADLSTLR